MQRIRLIAITALALVGLSACGSDSKSSGGNVTLPGGDTLPTDISLPDNVVPGNLTEECRAIATQFGILISQAFAPAGQEADLEQVFGDLSAKVPDELKADVTVLGAAFAAYGEVLKANNNDYTNPSVQAALEALSTPEVDAANDRISAYFDATCPQG